MQSHTDRKKISLQSQQVEDPQDEEQPKEQVSLTIPEHLKMKHQIQEISEISTKKVLKAGKFIKVQQFKAIINVYMTELNSQSFRVMLHYGNWKLEVSVIYTQIDERTFQDSKSLSGAFGVVKFVEFQGESYAVKGVPLELNDGDIDLTNLYKQYFLCSLADFLQAGPKICSLFGYDILITKNKAFFAMEQCKSVKCNQMEMVEHQLLQNLKVLNSIKIIHNDIKPGNVAYSNYHNKHVFIDFGLSKIIKESIGQKTNTKFVGTLSYCSEEMRKCYFLQTHKFVDLYENDLCCFNKTIRHMQILKQSQNSDSNSSLMPEQRQQLKILEGISAVLRLKYFIEQSNLRQVLKIVKSFIFKTTLYQIFQNTNTPKKISQNLQIQQKLLTVKNLIFSNALKQNRIDTILCNFFCENKKLVAAQRVIPVEQILESDSDLLDKYLSKPDFILKLFHFFQPFQKNFGNSVENRIQLMRLIVNKIYEKTSLVSGPTFFSEKIRQTLMFFYENLKGFKNYKVLCWLRLLFISIQNSFYLIKLQSQILQQILQPFTKMLKTAQFLLTRASMLKDQIEQPNQALLQSIQSQQIDESNPRQKNMKQFLCRIANNFNSYNCSTEEKREILGMVRRIGEGCFGGEEMVGEDKVGEETVGVRVVGAILLDLFGGDWSVLFQEPPSGLELKIYSNYFKHLRPTLPNNLQQIHKFFLSLSSQSKQLLQKYSALTVPPSSTSSTTSSPTSSCPPSISLETIQNIFSAYKNRNQVLGEFIQRVLDLDFLVKEVLYYFLEKIQEDLGNLYFNRTYLYTRLCFFHQFLLLLLKYQSYVKQQQKLPPTQKQALIQNLQKIFTRFLSHPNIQSLLLTFPDLQINAMLIQTKLNLQKGKTSQQMQQEIIVLASMLRPLPFLYPKLVVSFLGLDSYFQRFGGGDGGNGSGSGDNDYYGRIALGIAREYVRMGDFSIFMSAIRIFVRLVKVNNEDGKQQENLEMFLSLIEYLRKKNQFLTIKSEHQVFFYSVHTFCSTLISTRMLEIYLQVKHRTIELRCDLYAYFVFFIFLPIQEELDQAEKIRQVTRTTLCLKIMPSNTQIKIKSDLFKLYRFTIKFKTKRKIYICRKLEIKALTEDKIRIKSFIREIKNKIQRIPIKKIEEIHQKLLERVSKIERNISEQKVILK